MCFQVLSVSTWILHVWCLFVQIPEALLPTAACFMAGAGKVLLLCFWALTLWAVTVDEVHFLWGHVFFVLLEIKPHVCSPWNVFCPRFSKLKSDWGLNSTVHPLYYVISWIFRFSWGHGSCRIRPLGQILDDHYLLRPYKDSIYGRLADSKSQHNITKLS